MTEPRDWPPEQSAKGTLRPWHYAATEYLAVLFEDPEEAQRAQRGLRERGVPEDDLRLYDGEETLRMASRLQQERSARPRPGRGMIGMPQTITATSIQASELRVWCPGRTPTCSRRTISTAVGGVPGWRRRAALGRVR